VTAEKGTEVNDHSGLTPASGRGGPADPGTCQDWADWLRRTDARPPGRQDSSRADAEAAWTALTHLARREGFIVERAPCAGADGFTTWRNRKIRVRPDAGPDQAVIALAHQLGHVLLHRQVARLELSGAVPCTGIRKVEADSVAHLTAARTGISTEAITFPHPSSWAGTDPRAHPAATIQVVTSRIHAAVAAITRHLESAGIASPHPAAAASTRSPGTGQHAGPPVVADELVRVHDIAARFFRSQLTGSWVPGYLARRGLTPAVQDHWLAGYAPATWDALIRHLKNGGYTDAVIEASGLARRSRLGTLIDTFRDRAMFPIRSPDGTIIAFIGRAAEHADPAVPKYLNSPATSQYNKSKVLFGLWEARDALAGGARPVIAEGPLDAIAITTAGQSKLGGVSCCGTAFTASHATVLSQAADLPAAGVTVAFDADKAGRRAAVHAYHLLVPLTSKLAAASLPPGRDPAQILAESGPHILATMLTERRRPLPDLVINTEVASWSRWLRYPEGQIRALRAAAPLIAAMPPAHVARQVARLAAILRLDHETVTEALTEALTELVGRPARNTRQEPAGHAAVSLAPIRSAGDDIRQTQLAIEHAASGPSSAGRRERRDHKPRLTRRRAPR
jgi:DNA primase